jgi:hypothetical protein
LSILANGRVGIQDIEAEARRAGLLGEEKQMRQSKPFRSAKDELQIVSSREGFGREAVYYWSLPKHAPDPYATGAPIRAHHKNRAHMENEGAHESGGVRQGAHGGNGQGVRGDLDIPPRFDRRGEPPCAQCGLPGGTEWKYDGVEVRLHSYCEQPWIESYEAELSRQSQANNDGHCDVVTDGAASGDWETEI